MLAAAPSSRIKKKRVRAQRAEAAQPEPAERPPSQGCGEIGEIIQKILQYLPPEDIVRLRCVNQQWQGLIDSPGSKPIQKSLFLGPSTATRLVRNPRTGLLVTQPRQIVTANTALFCAPNAAKARALWLKGKQYRSLQHPYDDDIRDDMFLTDQHIREVEIALTLRFEAWTKWGQQYVLAETTFRVLRPGGVRYADIMDAIREAAKDPIIVTQTDSKAVLDIARTQFRFKNVRFSNWAAGSGSAKSRFGADSPWTQYFLEPPDGETRALWLRYQPEPGIFIRHDDEEQTDEEDDDEMAEDIEEDDELEGEEGDEEDRMDED